MTLILKGQKDRIDIKVTARIEGDLGRVTPEVFIATYRKPPSSEVKELVRRIGDKEAEPVSDDELLEQYLLDWRSLKDADGNEVPFTPENLAEVLETREYRAALVTGMHQAVFGKEALSKN